MNSNTAMMDMCLSPERDDHNYNGRRIIQLSLFVLLMLLAVLGYAEYKANAEQKLKVALIYKLTKFVEWPEKTAEKSDSFGICLIGMDAFGSVIDVLKKRNVDGQKINIRRIVYTDKIDENCSLIYINVPNRADLELIIRKLQNRPVLSISEHKEFVEMGGIVQLILSNNRMAFNINYDSSVKAGLSIAAPLLELANKVKKTNGIILNEGNHNP